MAKTLSKPKRWEATCSELRDTCNRMQEKLEEITKEKDQERVKDLAQEILSFSDDIRNEVSDLEDLKGEYENWRDNLPENLQQSNLGQKLEDVCNLDTDPENNLSDLESSVTGALDTKDWSEVESALGELDSFISELEGVDLPLGFGRD